ncbi:MAG: hypothetical protein ACTHLB_05430 [Parafilimonas sp.]
MKLPKMDIHNALALVVILLSFAFLFSLLFVTVPKDNEHIIDIACGAVLVSGFASIISYFYGSSKKQPEKPNTTITEITTTNNDTEA